MPEPDRRQQITDYLHEHIPVTRAMGVRVAAAGEAGVRLAAPLEPNLNHQSTAFGGSISAVAILSAWTLVHTRLRHLPGRRQIVIQRGSTEYLQPVRGEFEAWCAAPPELEWTGFLRTLERRGRARIELTSELVSDGAVVARFRGVYVAMDGEDGEDG
jgi:thioesterase domain-containing protein